MSVREYRRAILDILKDEYDVTDARLETSGHDHPRVYFYYGGRARALTLNRTVSGPGAVNMKRQDIRRELGPPPAVERSKPRRTLQNMTDELNRGANPMLNALSIPEFLRQVSLACYPDRSGKRRLIVYAPPSIKARFPSGVALTAVDDETWSVTATPGTRPSFTECGNKFLSAQFMVNGLEIFGKSPVDATWVDDALVIHLPPEKRLPKKELVMTRRPRQRETIELPPLVDRAIESTSTQNPIEPLPLYVASLSPHDIKRCLELVRKIEAETDYRLVKGKDSGTWAFVSRIE